MASSPSTGPARERLTDGIYKHGFGLKKDILDELNADYHSAIVDQLRENQYRWSLGQLHIRLAREFGFCYGVDKAIDYAYETCRRFPDRHIYLTTEIIHNPRVNRRLMEMGVRFLAGQYADGNSIDQIGERDVVILPAFGVDAGLLERLRASQAILVDTTCGSVVHVWKRVERYARDGYTALIHGKMAHEETVATCSHVTREGGRYLVVRDRGEAEMVCAFIRGGEGAAELRERFARCASAGFDFTADLARIGVANQTTMLSSESLEIADMVREAMRARYGEEHLEQHFRSFDTICNATQERQDAVQEMMRKPPDLMIVIGGFNSSNTTHLCEIASHCCPTYHIDEVECLVSPRVIRHRLPGLQGMVVESADWLPPRRPLEIGLTAGASTPNKVIGEVVERLAAWESVAES